MSKTPNTTIETPTTTTTTETPTTETPTTEETIVPMGSISVGHSTGTGETIVIICLIFILIALVVKYSIKLWFLLEEYAKDKRNVNSRHVVFYSNPLFLSLIHI